MSEEDWAGFKSELGETHSAWLALGPLVAEYNACVDDLAAAPSSGKEQELVARRERLRQSLVREAEHFTRLLAVLDAHLGTTTPAPDMPPSAAGTALTGGDPSSAAGAGMGEAVPETGARGRGRAGEGDDTEARGRTRGRSRTPQPAVRQVLAPGAQVAALVDRQWIVANVETHDEARRRYRVRDPEPMAGKNDLFWVPAAHVLPLHDWEHDPAAPTYAPGTRVLAVWPESTELYPGVVVEAPYRGPVCVVVAVVAFFTLLFFCSFHLHFIIINSQTQHRGDLPPLHYSIEFENSDGQHTPVPACQVVLQPRGD